MPKRKTKPFPTSKIDSPYTLLNGRRVYRKSIWINLIREHQKNKQPKVHKTINKTNRT